MLLQAGPTLVAAASNSNKLCCCCSDTHNTHTEEVAMRNTKATCATCHQCRTSSSVKNNVCGILLGAMPEPALLRHLRRWQACRRRRRKRRKGGGGEIKNQHKNNNSNNYMRATYYKQARVAQTARSGVEKRKLRKRVISTQATSYNCSSAVACSLLADYNASGMLEARNRNCLRARTTGTTTTTTVAAAARVALSSGVAPKAVWRLLDTRTATTTTTTKPTVTKPLLSKLVKCVRPLKKPKLVAVAMAAPACLHEQQQQQQQQGELSVITSETAPQVVDGLRIHSSVPLEQQLITRDVLQYKQQQQQQQHCLHISCTATAATVQRQAAKVNYLQHRSWRNLIGCVATKTTTTTTTCNVINTNANRIATAPAATTTISAHNCNVPSVSVAATKMSTTAAATLSASQQDIVPATTNRMCVETTKTNISASSCVAPCVIVRKSKCRSTVALTSALMAMLNVTTAATKAIQPVKSTKRDKPTQIKLARSKSTTTTTTTATLFGNIFTLLVGLLTLHATVLRCLLFTALTAATATVTAAPFVAQNSLLLLSQQRLEQHSQHNNNSNNTSSSSVGFSTFSPSSGHNYNHRHTTQAPPPPILNRMMDIEVLNGSSYTDTLKSLSSTLIEAAEAEQGDVNQLPIFDFGLPRNITARTGQAEAAIKCRVERLDDKSVSWIRKRDLHILTVATATYTSDKRFQVTSSKDGREWTLHVKSPQARDTGIYECQVNTEPKMSMAFQLNIIEIPADSRAIISGPADLHFKVGSAIILSCHVQQPSVRDIGPIYWYRGEHIITPFELHEDEESDSANNNNNQHSLHSVGGIVGGGMATPALLNNELAADVTATITNANALAGGGSSRGGGASSMGAAMAATAPHDGLSNDITPDFTARIAMESQLGDTMKSRLRISNAQTTDTGNYTCQPTTASSASVMVHVINDENPAAMQKSSASSMRMRTITTTMKSNRTRLATLLLLAAITTTIIETLMTRANIIMRATKATMAIIVAITTTTTTLLLTYLCGDCASQQQKQQQQQHFKLQEAQQVNWTLLKQQQQQQQQL